MDTSLACRWKNEFWDGLQKIASREKMPLATLVGQIYDAHNSSNLSSSIRVFVLNDLRARISQQQTQSG
jgi:predicted DNA-binding ribbon-helix-helix protein